MNRTLIAIFCGLTLLIGATVGIVLYTKSSSKESSVATPKFTYDKTKIGDWWSIGSKIREKT